jgi:hypothetical protein
MAYNQFEESIACVAGTYARRIGSWRRTSPWQRRSERGNLFLIKPSFHRLADPVLSRYTISIKIRLQHGKMKDPFSLCEV